MLKKLIIFTIGWLLIINLFSVLALNRFNLKPDTAYTWMQPSTLIQHDSWSLDIHQPKWDSFYYTDIAENGYSINGKNTLSNIAFFPLYPMFTKGLSSLTFGNVYISGWIISILSLFGTVYMLYKLLKEFHDDIDPSNVIYFLLIFPTAFFLNTVYSESLYLFLSITTMYFALKNKFPKAGLFGFLASLTRPIGILLLIPVVWEAIKAYKAGNYKKNPMNILSILMIPLGTILFFTYHYFMFGDFLLYFDISRAWGRAFILNKDHLIVTTGPEITNLILDLLFVLFGITVAVMCYFRKWTSYSLYVISVLIIALSTGTMMSIGRILLVLFPIYILVASIKNKLFIQLYTLTSILLLATYIILFVNGYWAG